MTVEERNDAYLVPRIEPLAGSLTRPLWSVMIPTFNCAKYLRQTLEAVLAQDLGVGQMQVEVVDDCSTRDDPGAVVRDLGRTRVDFHRKLKNEGATANFNTCIQRSRGHLVHILHGDDYVSPGFYAAMSESAARTPSAALIACRSFVVDADGVILGVTPRVLELESCARVVEGFFYGTPIQTPGIVVRRAFYETHGGFLPALVHTADCEMWARAVRAQGGVVTRDVLAYYRTFPANDSGRLARTGENLLDIERLNRVLAQFSPEFDPRRAADRICNLALSQAERFAENGDMEAAKANRMYWRRNAPIRLQLRRLAGKLARNVFG